MAVAKPVVDDLRQAAGPFRPLRARNAFRASGGSGGVELDRGRVVREVERAGCSSAATSSRTSDASRTTTVAPQSAMQ